jgi:hypothetical protein
MKMLSMGFVVAVALTAFVPQAALASGPRPFAFVSILDGSDTPFCGDATAPCRTALYAKRFVVRPGAPIFVADTGHFGEPAILTTLSLLAQQLSGRRP